MRMSHVYQPVMLRLLLGRNGRASVQDVARALLNEDRSQLEYYSEITKNMVGRVLANRASSISCILPMPRVSLCEERPLVLWLPESEIHHDTLP